MYRYMRNKYTKWYWYYLGDKYTDVYSKIQFDTYLKIYINVGEKDIVIHFLVQQIEIRLLMSSLVAQLVKNLPEMQETWVWSLGQKDPLKEEMAIHSSILV